MIGVYSENKLIKTYKSEQKSSEVLIQILDKILSKYELQTLIYANGPGNFTGIKVAYTILRTISIAKSCEIYAVSGFELNDFGPIRANKNMSFVFDNDQILLKRAEPKDFILPHNLSSLKLNKDTLPNYVLDAI